MAQKNSQTHKVEVKNFKEIYDYCYLNEIVDVNSFIDKCLKQGFDIQKYGMLGSEPKVQTEVKVVEKIVEVIKEVQLPPKEIEVIKYVDREVQVSTHSRLFLYRHELSLTNLQILRH